MEHVDVEPASLHGLWFRGCFGVSRTSSFQGLECFRGHRALGLATSGQHLGTRQLQSVRSEQQNAWNRFLQSACTHLGSPQLQITIAVTHMSGSSKLETPEAPWPPLSPPFGSSIPMSASSASLAMVSTKVA